MHSITEALEAHIQPLPNGAEFVRADLHVHSFGPDGSYDVGDPTMTPEAIVDTAIQENLGLISITDHNRIRNAARAISHAEGKSILVVPGVELSTPNGHLLVYLPTFRDLEQFYGKLTFSDDLKACQQTMQQCLDHSQEFGGFGVAAHIDLTSGIESMMPRFDAFKEGLLAHDGLLGLEISSVFAEAWYTERDDSADRKRLLAIRAKKRSEDDSYELPRVLGSDAHSLSALGKNLSGVRKVTRVKLDTPTFAALRIAFLDPVARIRIEDMIPAAIPHFVGLRLTGGFMDGQSLRFSKNLTCIIGGRGTGKSTMLESLRASAGASARDGLLDSDVWPDEIDLIYQDQAGRRHHLKKSKFYPVVNLSDPDEGITKVSIESYGQGETAETIQHCDKDPAILLGFLDAFIDLELLKDGDSGLRDQLLANQTEIERLKLEVNTLPDLQRAKANAEAQVKALKEKDAASIVDLEEKLARGKRFKEELINRLTTLFKTYREALGQNDLVDLIAGLDGTQLVVGQAEFQKVKDLVNAYSATVNKLAGDVETSSAEAIRAIRAELVRWNVSEAEVQGRIDTIRKELEQRGVTLDIAFIRKVTKDVADYTAKVNDARLKQARLAKLVEARRALVSQRRGVKSKTFSVRAGFAKQMNQNLKQTVVDYFVAVRFREGLLSRDLENIIKAELNWRTSQVPRAQLIASAVSPFQLLDAIYKGDDAPLTAIRDEAGQTVFTSSEARQILDVLKADRARFQIERCQFDDRPEITVTRQTQDANGKSKYLQRDFTKLSLGQQQSVLLTILLFSKSTEPLIIDQPEDNLDSEFIYKTFVRSLRRVKEQRQVIVVTHNANIAVLGDAELIIPLRASSEKAVIRERGSIDNAKTKDITCTILEGSLDAFRKRQRMYQH